MQVVANLSRTRTRTTPPDAGRVVGVAVTDRTTGFAACAAPCAAGANAVAASSAELATIPNLRTILALICSGPLSRCSLDLPRFLPPQRNISRHIQRQAGGSATSYLVTEHEVFLTVTVIASQPKASFERSGRGEIASGLWLAWGHVLLCAEGVISQLDPAHIRSAA